MNVHMDNARTGTSLADAIPIELMDQIFKIMVHASISLSSCLLVSRYWSHAAYPYHYEKMRYTITWQSGRSAEQDSTSSANKARSFDDLVVFIRQSSRVSACVKSICVQGDDPRATFDLSRVTELVSLLPRLQKLEISELRFTCTSFGDGVPSSSSTKISRAIEELKIGDIRDDNFASSSIHAVGCLLKDFRSIHKLLLNNLEDDFDLLKATWKDHRSAIQVRQLDVGNNLNRSELEAALNVLHHIIDPSSLTTLNISVIALEYPITIQRFLETHGMHLKELTCGSFNVPSATFLDLTTYMGLESVGVSINVPCGAVDSDDYNNFTIFSWPSAIQTLQHAPSTITRMSLKLVFDLFDLMEDEDLLYAVDILERLANDLNWPLMNKAIDAHPDLEVMEIRIHIDPINIDYDDDMVVDNFQKHVKAIIEAKCFGTSDARKKLLCMKFGVE